jgi:uncharacterized protein involved in type VI secretion and phage assembly
MLDTMMSSIPDQDIIQGMIIGLVIDNEDPEGLGRIKVSFPLSNGNIISNWARLVSFSAGPDRGAMFLPQRDDEVLVGFLFGKISMPYIIGALWNGQALPPLKDIQQQNVNCIKTKSGNTITLDDTEDNQKIIIQDRNDNQIKIDSATNTITIMSNSNININCKERLTIDASELVINVDGSASINVGSINIEADAEASIMADMVNIN